MGKFYFIHERLTCLIKFAKQLWESLIRGLRGRMFPSRNLSYHIFLFCFRNYDENMPQLLIFFVFPPNWMYGVWPTPCRSVSFIMGSVWKTTLFPLPQFEHDPMSKEIACSHPKSQPSLLAKAQLQKAFFSDPQTVVQELHIYSVQNHVSLGNGFQRLSDFVAGRS